MEILRFYISCAISQSITDDAWTSGHMKKRHLKVTHVVWKFKENSYVEKIFKFSRQTRKKFKNSLIFKKKKIVTEMKEC